ncbi:MAG: hypothetical protein ACFFA6_08340 [Promethearchaeota archaeon]
MGKDKKRLGIKTTRYFTKTCTNCRFEYPNWFTNCPKCGAAWDEIEAKRISTTEEAQKKTIKIVVKITEEDFNKAISIVNLIFSADKGKSWYQMEMDIKMDYFIAEIAEVPVGSIIVYYIEVYLEDGERIIENNNGKYFYYKVGAPIEETQQNPSKPESKVIKDNIKQAPIKPQEYFKSQIRSQPPKTQITREMVEKSTKIPQEPVKPPIEQTSQNGKNDNITIFGRPQTRIDPNLKVCPHCNSKIKKMWSICPICGNNI